MRTALACSCHNLDHKGRKGLEGITAYPISVEDLQVRAVNAERSGCVRKRFNLKNLCALRGETYRAAGARCSAGFTLLELLVALAIFALISAMAYGGLQSVMTQQQETAARSDRLADLQKAYRIMQRDLEQIVSREVRNEFGDRIGVLVGGSGFDGVEFSRGGHPNPAGFLRSEIQRVAYVPDQDILLRRTWRVLDRAQDTEPDEQRLVESMSRFSMRFLDQANEWQERWPPAIGLGEEAPGLPVAVEVQLELDELGILTWLFRLPQDYVPSVLPAAGGDGEDDGSSDDGGQEEGEGGDDTEDEG